MNHSDQAVLSRVASTDADLVTFTNRDNETVTRPIIVLLSIYNWAEHGSPDQITVTIQPGNALDVKPLTPNEARKELGLPPMGDTNGSGE